MLSEYLANSNPLGQVDHISLQINRSSVGFQVGPFWLNLKVLHGQEHWSVVVLISESSCIEVLLNFILFLVYSLMLRVLSEQNEVEGGMEEIIWLCLLRSQGNCFSFIFAWSSSYKEAKKIDLGRSLLCESLQSVYWTLYVCFNSCTPYLFLQYATNHSLILSC